MFLIPRLTGQSMARATTASVLCSGDFIHKLSMALKEARETYYWLRLIEKGEVLPLTQFSELLKESNEIVALPTASVITAKENYVRG